MLSRALARSPYALAAAGLSLALAACADPSTGPKAASDDFTMSAAVVGSLPSAPAGSQSINLSSSNLVMRCGYNPTLTPTAGMFGPASGQAFDLTTALTMYNPGWPAPLAGSSWIGAQADANRYRVAPGSYCFEQQFTLATGATNPLINLTVRADNTAIVYLNGTEIGRHTPTSDNPTNWNTSLLISDATAFVPRVNTLRVILINTRIGQTSPTSADRCAEGPQPDSPAPDRLADGWSPVTCLNPSALDYTGTVYYALPAVTGNQGCSLGFWKNKGAKSGLYNKSQKVNTVFNFAGTPYVSQGNQTFLQALGNGGGGIDALLRQAVAAYLNAQSASVDYPLTTAQVIAKVNGALNGTLNMNTVANQLDGYNNLHGAKICGDDKDKDDDKDDDDKDDDKDDDDDDKDKDKDKDDKRGRGSLD